jgi:hypothetical protein
MLVGGLVRRIIMTDRPKNIPPSPKDLAEDRRVRRDKGKGPKHIVEAGLPPGISIDEAFDPGKNTPAPGKEKQHAR